MSNQPVNLDPSLAFTALLEMWQGFGQLPSPIGHRITAALASDMTTASPANRWEFAQQWVALRRPGSYAGRVVIQAGDDAPVPMYGTIVTVDSDPEWVWVAWGSSSLGTLGAELRREAIDGLSPAEIGKPWPGDDAGLVAQIQCCGEWIDYPAEGAGTACPVCRSVFTVTRTPAGER